MCRWVDIFQSHMTPSWWCYKLLERSVTWTSPKSCIYPTLVTIDPVKVQIMSILFYKNSNCWLRASLFSVNKSFWFINSNYFPFWKGCTICLAQLTFMILYLSHRDRLDLLNTRNIWAWNYKIMLQISS